MIARTVIVSASTARAKIAPRARGCARRALARARTDVGVHARPRVRRRRNAVTEPKPMRIVMAFRTTAVSAWTAGCAIAEVMSASAARAKRRVREVAGARVAEV